MPVGTVPGETAQTDIPPAGTAPPDIAPTGTVTTSIVPGDPAPAADPDTTTPFPAPTDGTAQPTGFTAGTTSIPVPPDGAAATTAVDAGTTTFPAPADGGAPTTTFDDGVQTGAAPDPATTGIAPDPAANPAATTQVPPVPAPTVPGVKRQSACDVAPDYIGVHVYTDDIDTFKTMVTSYYTTFNLPVVVSEFACFTFGGTTPSQDQVNSFMSQATSWLDSQPWVIKYAWFGTVRDEGNLQGVPDVNRLMDASGNITPLGQQYMNGGQ